MSIRFDKIQPKDGNLHTYWTAERGMVRTREAVDEILTYLQSKNYEIVDIKLGSSSQDTIIALIMYK